MIVQGDTINYSFWDTFYKLTGRQNIGHLIPNSTSNRLKHGLGYDYLASMN